MILGAVYMLWVYQRVMLGKVTHGENEGLRDLSAREAVILVPLIVAVFFMGLCPNYFLSKMQTSVNQVVQRQAPSAFSPYPSAE